MAVSELHIVAGPNGSGKSTYVARWKPGFPFFDPDEIAKQVRNAPGNELIEAGRILHCRIEQRIDQRESFGLETTLSGKTVFKTLHACKKAGFQIVLHFIFVEGLHVSRSRVVHRVAMGGHGIPEVDQERRFDRSLANAVLAMRMADIAYFYDNSLREGHRLVAEFHKANLVQMAPDAPDWLKRAAGI